MKLNTVLSRTLGSLMLLFILFSCENDFQEVGKGLVDASNFTSGSSDQYQVDAYSFPFFNGIGVQTNGLAAGALGIYQDTLYGNTTASYLSQVDLEEYDPDFGRNPVVDTVVIDITYFSTQSINADNEAEYELDSVYGSSPINITGYRSNYFLSQTAPPDFTDNAVYYSNDLQQFSDLEGEVIFEASNVIPSKVAVVDQTITSVDGEVNTSTVSPRLRLTITDSLSLDFWQRTILDQDDSDVLFNSNAFRNYFRGIYLKSESVDDSGNFFLFDRANSGVTVKYTSGSENSRSQSSLQLNLSGTSVIGYENDFKTGITNIQTGNQDGGDESLLLKGGQGSMAVVELFGPDADGDGIPEQLQIERDKNQLIQEANLEFFVNEDLLGEIAQTDFNLPRRIFIYNLDTNQPLVDYFADAATSSTGVVSAVGTSHLGPLQESTTATGRSYTLRITEDSKNLLNPDNDSPATRLGVIVSQNLTLVGAARIENTSISEVPNRVPFSSVISQRGTILYGTGENIPEDKKLKLRIFYSEVSN